MTNAKVTVTKEVAEAIEELREQGVTTDTLLQALVNGYEVEKSPEDKVREYYDRCRSTREDAIGRGLQKVAQHYDGQAIGASITLDILGIKIGGINA